MWGVQLLPGDSYRNTTHVHLQFKNEDLADGMIQLNLSFHKHTCMALFDNALMLARLSVEHV